MNRNFFITVAAAGFLLFAGCNIFIEIPETTITATNEMIDFDLVLGGKTWPVEGIDLYNVTIGDVSYASIPAGDETDAQVTSESGRVNVFIGKAIATVDVVGPGGLISPVDYEFKNIAAMELTLNEGEDNLVVFDDATSETILRALAKKLAE